MAVTSRLQSGSGECSGQCVQPVPRTVDRWHWQAGF